MGEIADMMLEGILCECCGVYMGEGDGYPVRCAGCQGVEKELDVLDEVIAPIKSTCPMCSKVCADGSGVKQHIKAKHTSVHVFNTRKAKLEILLKKAQMVSSLEISEYSVADLLEEAVTEGII